MFFILSSLPSDLENEVENKKAQILNLQQHLSALEKDIKRNEEFLRRRQIHYRELKVKKKKSPFVFFNLLLCSCFQVPTIHLVLEEQFSDFLASSPFTVLKELSCVWVLPNY